MREIKSLRATAIGLAEDTILEILAWSLGNATLGFSK
jgi:hypothetical protein